HGRPDTIKALPPAYFSMVMATGIVAIAMNEHRVPLLPAFLYGLNLFFLVGLLLANAIRLGRYRARFMADIHSHARGVGFFTWAPAMGILGSQTVLQFGAPVAALVFWILAGVLWFITMYGILTVLTVQQPKPSLSSGLNGSWLV